MKHKMKHKMKHTTLAIALAALMLAAPQLAAPQLAHAFSDVRADTPYRTAIGSLSDDGVIDGYPDGTFRPDAELTRAEFCKIIVEAFGGGPNGSPSGGGPNGSPSGGAPFGGIPSGGAPFSDIGGHWAREHIASAAAMGLVSGVGDGLFDPDGILTCEQAVAIAARLVGGERASYPIDYLAYAMEEGISEGVPVVTGRDITRGEAAQLIYNILEKRRFEEEEKAYLAYLASLADADEEPPSSGPQASVEEALPMLAPQPVADGSRPGSVAYGEYADADYGVVPPGWYDDTAEYLTNGENAFVSPLDSPLSTFSLDVNTASYSIVRRHLQAGRVPEAGAVKIEEMVNYFAYDLERPAGGDPFKVSTEVHACPWNGGDYLAMVALQGYDIAKEDLPPSNLVFLIDISGSMFPPNRLPLAQRAMCLLADQLRPQDTVTIVVYASSTGTVLEPTSGREKDKIKRAIYGLKAGGSTYGAGGIQLAYEAAEKSFVEGGNNRVILCTDGDFNVGISSVSELEDLISEKRESGVFLSVLGFGMSNLKDDKMETLATKGNGNYAYIDNLKEANKVLVEDMSSTIFAIAKDVKLQVEFNPQTVAAYRLLGYEKRLLRDEDFADDAKDAGEMGAGHSMIAFYEIVPAGGAGGDGGDGGTADPVQIPQAQYADEFMNISLRYKLPDSDQSVLMDTAAVARLSDLAAPPSETFSFASAVAEWGLLLGGSEYKAYASIEGVLDRAYRSRGKDAFGYRAEFVQLVDLSRLVLRQGR